MVLVFALSWSSYSSHSSKISEGFQAHKACQHRVWAYHWWNTAYTLFA